MGNSTHWKRVTSENCILQIRTRDQVGDIKHVLVSIGTIRGATQIGET